MKTALLLHGNLRTFFMPLREKEGRLCDEFHRKLIAQNNPDVFIVTEGNDFYLDGTQYCNRLEVVNCDTFRLHTKVEYADAGKARDLLTTALQNHFGNRLKGLIVEDPIDSVENDPKYQLLQRSSGTGASPPMMVKQWLKVKSCHQLMERYEQNNQLRYNLIMKCRFDSRFQSDEPLKLRGFDYGGTEIYVPGVKGPIIYDWYAFGRRRPMDTYCNLYDRLGCTLDRKVYLRECRSCGNAFEGPRYDTAKETCPVCNSDANVFSGEVTIASEHHIYRMFQDEGIRFKYSQHGMYIYRYRDGNDTDIKTAIRHAGMDGVKVVNHTTDRCSDPIN